MPRESPGVQNVQPCVLRRAPTAPSILLHLEHMRESPLETARRCCLQQSASVWAWLQFRASQSRWKSIWPHSNGIVEADRSTVFAQSCRTRCRAIQADDEPPPEFRSVRNRALFLPSHSCSKQAIEQKIHAFERNLHGLFPCPIVSSCVEMSPSDMRAFCTS